jgi:nucleotidyltransferase/DNA polymerase involved in DNA repair
MKRIVDRIKQLREYYPIAEVYLDKDIACIAEAMHDSDNKPNVTRIINSLRLNDYNDLNDVFNATREEINQIRNLGAGCQMLLYALLKRISDNPQAIINCPAVAKNNVSTLQPQINSRIEEIKARLREMGMIN